MPLVDIVIPVFNRAWCVNRAICSVQNQSFKDFHLWVVDDGSTDNTIDVLHKALAQIPSGKMSILQLKTNKGVSVARNLAIQAGSAKWVAFLDSDDEWHTHKLFKQLEYAKTHPQYPLIHTNETWLRNGLKINQKKKHLKKGGRIFTHSLEMCRISPSSALINRTFLLKIGLFREDFPVCEDYELWLRATARSPIGFINLPLVIKHGGHSDQLSHKYKAMDEWRVRAMFNCIHNPFIKSQEKHQLLKTLQKKCRILLNGYQKHKNFVNQSEISAIATRASST